MGKILIVDDEKGMQTTLSAFLRNDGYTSDVASNAIDAMEMIKSTDYDVVVSDVIMPLMTGVELLDKIREFSEDIQVIIMTGEPTLETAVKAVHGNASSYLSKPINKKDFLKAIKDCLSTKRIIDIKRKNELKNLEYQKELEEIIEIRTHALRQSMKSVIMLLTQVVEYRDPYTAGHQRRVGNLSAEIARKMNLNVDSVETVRIIGYIHDIGKITVPAEILSKPGRLSDIEFTLIKTHTQTGFNMLSSSDLPPIISTAVYEHHERINGCGYPRGLTGDQIQIESKILMVADVVEAMLSHRPYRASLGIDAALAEIEENADVLYDSEVVLKCLELFRVDGYKIDDYQYETYMPIM